LVARIVPLISSVYWGLVVPTPTFPFAAIESRACPAVLSKMSRRPAPFVLPEPVESKSKTWPPVESNAELRHVGREGAPEVVVREGFHAAFVE
jgi:hypothetical protein